MDEHAGRAFVAALRQLGQRERAMLRHSIHREPGTDPPAWPLIEPLLPVDLGDPARAAHYLVAALWAQLPRLRPGGPRRSFGGAVGAYAAQERERRRATHIPPEIERRFLALLDATWEEVPRHLIHLATLLRQHGVRLAWGQLVVDLVAWDAPECPVQRRWLRHFLRVATRQRRQPPDDDALLPTHAARYLGVQPATLRHYTRRGLLTPIEVAPGRYRYPRAALDVLKAAPPRRGRPRRSTTAQA